MRISLLAWGSRGDVEPFVALARGLAQAGRDVRVLAALDYRDLVERAGVAFTPFPISMDAAIHSPAGRAWLAGSRGSPWREAVAMRRLAAEFAPSAAVGMRSAGTTDTLISGTLTFPAAVALAAHTGQPHVLAQLMPLTPSAHLHANQVAPTERPSRINRALGEFAQWGMHRMFADVTDFACRGMGVPPLRYREFARLAARTPTLLAVSPQVVPPPPDWSGVDVTGYWTLPRGPAWRPPAALERFLADGPPPVYVGFGSMPLTDPQRHVDLVAAALRHAGRRGVLLDQWGGRGAPTLPDHLVSVSDVPHDWLFLRCAGVVHHGGAGTTGAAIRAGVPAFVVPHMGDQPYWGRRVHAMGVGPRPVPLHRLTEGALTRAVTSLVGDAGQALRARDLGVRVRAEDGVATAVTRLADLIPA